MSRRGGAAFLQFLWTHKNESVYGYIASGPTVNIQTAITVNEEANKHEEFMFN